MTTINPNELPWSAEAVALANQANQAYGALTEGLYLAGFTFERAMGQTLRLLKDGSWRLVGPGFVDVNDFVRSLRLDQFRVIAEHRREFAERVRELQPQVSNRALAGALGVDESTIRTDRAGNPAPSEKTVNENNSGKDGAAGNPAHGAHGGRRDARLIVNRDDRKERAAEKFRSMIEPAWLAGQFSVQVSDPPLDDEFGLCAGVADVHYPLMADDDLVAMADKVKRATPEHAVHFMWVSPHMLLHGARLLEAWGFSFRTHAIWDKGQPGHGQWFLQEHEDLLVGRKGEFPVPPELMRIGSILRAPRGSHSAKPDLLLEHIERWWPEAPKIELFRRGPPRPGWSAWGNEAVVAP